MITKTKKNSSKQKRKIEEYKKRMLAWDNPVEYVNNMYGCHSHEATASSQSYFKTIFDKKVPE